MGSVNGPTAVTWPQHLPQRVLPAARRLAETVVKQGTAESQCHPSLPWLTYQGGPACSCCRAGAGLFLGHRWGQEAGQQGAKDQECIQLGVHTDCRAHGDGQQAAEASARMPAEAVSEQGDWLAWLCWLDGLQECGSRSVLGGEFREFNCRGFLPECIESKLNSAQP